MSLTQERFEHVVLKEPWRQWELHQGELREKPPMTFGHNQITILLGVQFARQIDLSRFVLRIGHGHVERPEHSYYIPDIFVVPLERTIPDNAADDIVDSYSKPVLLVVEIWSPSMGDYDVDSKLPAYRARGDLEIWRVHPYERTLTVWRLKPDGSYVESIHRHGVVEPVALPGVRIDLDALFNP